MKQLGFSLLEIIIICCIVSIMLAFALPNYSQHLTHQRRLAAGTALMKLAGHMEAYFAEHNTYEGANFKSLELQEYAADKNYHLIISATANQFKLAAIPQGEQAWHDGRCGSLILNSKGVKRVTGYGDLNQCW